MTRRLPHHCARCANRWDGYNTAHCGACHETFTGVEAFDRHRKGAYEPDARRCVVPESAGLELDPSRTYKCYRRSRSDRAARFLNPLTAVPGVSGPERALTRV